MCCRRDDGVDDDEIAEPAPDPVQRTTEAVPLPSVCHGGRIDPPDFQLPDNDLDLTPPNLQPHNPARVLEPLNTAQNQHVSMMLGFDLGGEAGAREAVQPEVRKRPYLICLHLLALCGHARCASECVCTCAYFEPALPTNCSACVSSLAASCARRTPACRKLLVPTAITVALMRMAAGAPTARRRAALRHDAPRIEPLTSSMRICGRHTTGAQASHVCATLS